MPHMFAIDVGQKMYAICVSVDQQKNAYVHKIFGRKSGVKKKISQAENKTKLQKTNNNNFKNHCGNSNCQYVENLNLYKLTKPFKTDIKAG